MLAYTLPLTKMAMQLLHEQAFVRNGPRQANALLARTAPGPPVTLRKTEVGIKPAGQLSKTKARAMPVQRARAKERERARKTTKLKPNLEPLLPKASEADPLPRKTMDKVILLLPGKGNRAASPAKKRGKSPSGELDRPPCFRHLRGNCTDANCKYWHSPHCRDFKAGNCAEGGKCEFVHVTEKVKAAIKANKAQVKCAHFL